MKKLIFIISLLLFAAISPAQIRISQIQGDTSGAATLKTELKNRDTRAVADGRYFLVSNGVPAANLYYTKKQVLNIRVKDELVSGLQAYGSQVKALPYGVALPHLFASTATILDGVYYSALFEIKDTIIINGVGWVQQTPGQYVADGYNGFSIYSCSGGTDTKVFETANDGNIWKASAGNATKAFSSQQTLLPGNYKLAALWNSSSTTVSPAIYAHTAVSGNIIYLLPNNQKMSGTYTGQSSMPPTVTGSNLVSTANYLGLYLY